MNQPPFEADIAKDETKKDISAKFRAAYQDRSHSDGGFYLYGFLVARTKGGERHS